MQKICAQRDTSNFIMNSQARLHNAICIQCWFFPSDKPVLTNSVVPTHKMTKVYLDDPVCIICLPHIFLLLTKLIMNFCHHFLFWFNLSLGIHSFWGGGGEEPAGI